MIGATPLERPATRRTWVVSMPRLSRWRTVPSANMSSPTAVTMTTDAPSRRPPPPGSRPCRRGPFRSSAPRRFRREPACGSRRSRGRPCCCRRRRCAGCRYPVMMCARWRRLPRRIDRIDIIDPGGEGRAAPPASVRTLPLRFSAAIAFRLAGGRHGEGRDALAAVGEDPPDRVGHGAGSQAIAKASPSRRRSMKRTRPSRSGSTPLM